MKKIHLPAKFFCLLTVLLLFVPKLSAQIADESRFVFDETQIARVDVTISPAALAWMYSHTSSDSEHVASVRFRNAVLDETFDTVGFRLRGATSRTSQKKSFKIDFNRFVSGQKLKGLKDLNLNGKHNDLSIIRSKLSLDLLNAVGLKTARISYCADVIGQRNYGLAAGVLNMIGGFAATIMIFLAGVLKSTIGFSGLLMYVAVECVVVALALMWTARREFD